MHRRIGWYLTELESRLRGRMPAPELARFLDETEDHLCASAEESTHPDGEAAAIRRFGKPAKIARSVLGVADGTVPYWRDAWVPMLATILLSTTLAAWNSFDDVRMGKYPLPHVLSGVLGLALLLALVRCRRRIVLGLALGSAIGALCAVPLLASRQIRLLRGTMPITVQRTKARDALAWSQANVRVLDLQLPALERARQAYEMGSIETRLEPYSGYAHRVPVGVDRGARPHWLHPNSIGVEPADYIIYREVRSFAEAKKLWLDTGKGQLALLLNMRAMNLAMIEEIPRELAKPWMAQVTTYLPEAPGMALFSFVWLAGIHGAALWLRSAARVRRRPLPA